MRSKRSLTVAALKRTRLLIIDSAHDAAGVADGDDVRGDVAGDDAAMRR